MTTLYLIRHGQSKANEKDAFAGFWDVELTEKGKEQARKTANFLKSIKPDLIYSSDLKRAYATAEFTAKNYGIKIVTDVELREMDAGEWDGMTLKDIEEKYEREYCLWRDDIGRSFCPGGETTKQLQDRVVKRLYEIAKTHKDKTIFIFSHATPVRAFSAYCSKLTLDQMNQLPWPKNASVTKVEFEGEEFKLVDYSNDLFMGELNEPTTKIK